MALEQDASWQLASSPVAAFAAFYARSISGTIALKMQAGQRGLFVPHSTDQRILNKVVCEGVLGALWLLKFQWCHMLFALWCLLLKSLCITVRLAASLNDAVPFELTI